MTRFRFMAIILCLIFVLGAGFSNTAIADDMCVQRDSITATGDYLQATGEWHYPCGNKANLRGTYIITSDPPPHPARMRYILDGSGWTMGANNYQPAGEHDFTATIDVSLLSQYRLIIEQYIDGSGFESPATFRVYYYNVPFNEGAYFVGGKK